MSKFKNIALSLIAIVLLSASVNATNVTTLPTPESADPFTVKYLGEDGDYLVFEVVVKSADAKRTSFEISDKAEGAIYSSNIRSAYQVQTMKIEKRFDQQLNFKLVIGNEVYSKSFAILEPVALEAK